MARLTDFHRQHGDGLWGAMRIGEGARSANRVLGEDEMVHAALGRKRERRGRQALSVKVKIHLALPSDL
jgi:hypothetical protein